VELEGDAGFLESLPGVAAVRPQGQRQDIELAESADPQELLAAIVARARVRAFEIKQPSLHEIFVRLVGASHAQDS
jgi:ABC-2 type transport system ATP-binding protein